MSDAVAVSRLSDLGRGGGAVETVRDGDVVGVRATERDSDSATAGVAAVGTVRDADTTVRVCDAVDERGAEAVAVVGGGADAVERKDSVRDAVCECDATVVRDCESVRGVRLRVRVRCSVCDGERVAQLGVPLRVGGVECDTDGVGVKDGVAVTLGLREPPVAVGSEDAVRVAVAVGVGKSM